MCRGGFQDCMVACAILLVTVAACDRVSSTVAPEFSLTSFSEWSDPVNLVAVNSPFIEQQPVLSRDELALYFSSARPGGVGGNDIWVSTRPAPDAPWGTPVNLGEPVNSAYNDQAPALSSDGHLLFFQSNRPGGAGMVDIYVSQRADPKNDLGWRTVTALGPGVNTAIIEAQPWYLQNIENGSLNLYFVRTPTVQDADIYATAISRNGETSGPAIPITALNFAVAGVVDARPVVRQDGKEVVFFSDRPGGLGEADLYVSTRQNTADAWSPPVNMGAPLNGPYRDFQPFLSLDGRILLFLSNRPGGLGASDIWMSTRQRTTPW